MNLIHIYNELESHHRGSRAPRTDPPILLVPYMWIGDFVRCHSVVKLLRAALPEPTGRYTGDDASARRCSTTCRACGRGSSANCRAAAASPNTSALADRLAARTLRPGPHHAAHLEIGARAFSRRHPERTGFAGEFRFGLLNDVRYGERKLPRMIDQCGALALPRATRGRPNGRCRNSMCPVPEIAAWRARRGLAADRRARRGTGARRGRPAQALAG